MRALVYTQYGGPEQLKLQELDIPVPKESEVLVKVEAASLNDWDLGLLHGDPINRVLNGLRRPKRIVLGSDIAGRVEAVGPNATRFKVGDVVYGDLSGRWGGFAEYCCAHEKALASKPAAMSFVQAAAIPQAAMLAVQGLLDVGRLQRGQTLLINGAGGGVGTFAIQLAKIIGAHTTGVDSTGKLDLLRDLGFDEVVDYTREDFTKRGQQYHLILDVKTNRPFSAYARALQPGGAYVTVGGSIGRLLQGLLLKPWMARVQDKHLRIVSLKPNKDLGYMNELFEAGSLVPVIEGPFAITDFAEAFRLFSAGAHKGKVVLTL